MLTLLVALFKTSGFGALLGLFGGVLNRFLDFKKIELDHKHELALRNADMKLMELEAHARVEVAMQEREGREEVAGYAALAAAHEYDRASYGGGWVDTMRGLVRPLVTGLFVVLVFWINWRVMGTLREQPLTTDMAFDVLEWIMLQASVCIGYYFGSRAGIKGR